VKVEESPLSGTIYQLLHRISMSTHYVLGVCLQVSNGVEMMVIEFQIEVMSLEIRQTEDSQDGAGEKLPYSCRKPPDPRSMALRTAYTADDLEALLSYLRLGRQSQWIC
jgi:hypothetical protein